jgi:hypothetical protein
MAEDEETESEKLTEELKAERRSYGLYDVVKQRIWHEYLRAEEHLFDIIDRDLPEGRTEIPYMTRGSRLVASVLTLYLLIKPKIGYIADEKYKKLYELDDYYLGRKKIGEMTFLEAREYLDLLREFLETLGITAFEIAKLSGADEVIKDAIEE